MIKKLEMDLEGMLTYRGKAVRAKPIGRPKVLWCPEGQEERHEFRFNNIMEGFARTVATSEIPDSYLEGEVLKRDNINYTSVQFYKIEPSE